MDSHDSIETGIETVIFRFSDDNSGSGVFHAGLKGLKRNSFIKSTLRREKTPMAPHEDGFAGSTAGKSGQAQVEPAVEGNPVSTGGYEGPQGETEDEAGCHLV